MAKIDENNFLDIYNLELQIREKINELHWKTESLEETQKELTETRRSLYETQNLLDDERRSSNQLKIQLNSAIEIIKRMEDEKIKNEAYNVRIKMNFETAEIERDVLINQAKNAKLENMEMKIKIQELETNVATGKMINETLEASMIELKNNTVRLQNTVHSNIVKLKHEQDQLRKSLASSTEFGQRIQASLKTSHIARQRDKKKIEELQKRIDTLNSREISVPASAGGSHMDIGSLHLQMESTLQELRKKLEKNAIEEKLSLICSELQKVDDLSLKD